jgi:hypothetical protein
MSLFTVQHKHTPETCPAKDGSMGSMLLAHIGRNNASQFGISSKEEAVIDNQHTFFMILEAEDARIIEQFMAPFRQVGEVNIWPASTCETVVGRSGC